MTTPTNLESSFQSDEIHNGEQIEPGIFISTEFLTKNTVRAVENEKELLQNNNKNIQLQTPQSGPTLLTLSPPATETREKIRKFL